ncbi:MAG: hypothetical protein JXB32_21005, partial [Deltaproteobacteria bacterium]|nr:hypothetical protein [Deltaproteobacteria bacterium]
MPGTKAITCLATLLALAGVVAGCGSADTTDAGDVHTEATDDAGDVAPDGPADTPPDVAPDGPADTPPD